MVFVVSIAQVILIIDLQSQQKLHFKCGNHDDLFRMYRLDESSTTLGNKHGGEATVKAYEQHTAKKQKNTSNS
jgi:hypothetical protein